MEKNSFQPGLTVKHNLRIFFEKQNSFFLLSNFSRNSPSWRGLLELLTIFIKTLSPSSELIFSEVGVEGISKGHSICLKTGIISGAFLTSPIIGGLGLNKGQSEVSSSWKI